MELLNAFGAAQVNKTRMFQMIQNQMNLADHPYGAAQRLFIYVIQTTMPNKSGIQIIRTKPFSNNITDIFILKIKNT